MGSTADHGVLRCGHDERTGEEARVDVALARVPATHALWAIKKLADAALVELSSNAMYSGLGRPSIPPERLLKATLLMGFYSLRSEGQFCEQLDYNILFRWFLDIDMDEEGSDPTVFTKNRERLLARDVAGKFFHEVAGQARSARLISSDHSPSTARSSTPGRRSRASGRTRRRGASHRRMTQAIRRSTSTARNGVIRRTSRRQTLKRSANERPLLNNRASQPVLASQPSFFHTLLVA